MQALLAQTAQAFWTAFSGLIWPALFFAGLAFIVRGNAAFASARNASGEVRTNLILFALDVVIVSPLLLMALTFVGGLMQAAGLRLFSATHWNALPAFAVGAIAIFAGDFIGYWRHRFEHIAFIWPAHAVHHSDTVLTWTTGLRFHPLNRFTTALIDTSFLALLGLPLWALMANNLVRHFYGMFIHMDLPWTYGPLGRVFVSPAMHRWHHVRDADGAGANFATVFAVFDQAFRTHHAPGPCEVPLGVRDDMGRGVLGQLWHPFKIAGRQIFPRPFSASAHRGSRASAPSPRVRSHAGPRA